jgi:DNA (cytosine-5)-methyltransferase 1
MSDPNQSRFTFIDLFAGIGGFRIALTQLGGRCLNFSEINGEAIKTYCANFGEGIDRNLGDITKIPELPPHNILTAGVPCQSWSIAGRNLGFDDDRGQLWNDTIFLLNKAKPDAFIFENVKGLADPRNKEALLYILSRIRQAGYFANYHILNSFDFGVPQNRIRIYIVGFRDEEVAQRFRLPRPCPRKKLADILTDYTPPPGSELISNLNVQRDLFGDVVQPRAMSLSTSDGFNDYFLFNDLRNGHSTIHSWDILNTTERQREICDLLLKNRRKKTFGPLDGNPLSLAHFQGLEPTITQSDLDTLVQIGILRAEEYSFAIVDTSKNSLNEAETLLLNSAQQHGFVVDVLHSDRQLKIKRVPITKTLEELSKKGFIACNEIRYDFKNTKISTGLYGVNRIFLPSSDIYPTLVASDTNDFVTHQSISATNQQEFKAKFIAEIYRTKNFRKITKPEACRIQGFPDDFTLPENRTKWMKLIGNSVSVPVIASLGQAILDTGLFDKSP